LVGDGYKKTQKKKAVADQGQHQDMNEYDFD
jgi:hypothetical protein